MSLQILHASDIHYAPEHKAEALASLRVLRDTAREREVDLVAIAGDLFDRGLQATDRDGYAELVAIIQEILGIAPIVAVRGTPSHDPPGAYDVLTRLQAKHEFTAIEPGTAYYLHASGDVVPFDCGDENRLLILGVPEPGKAWLLANGDGLGSAEASQAVVDAMKALLLGLGGLRRKHPELATVLLYHGAIRGATMGAGQLVSGTELAIGAEDLALAGADYYPLGHIHKAQQIGEMPAYYAGSAYPVDWGELDQKACNLVELLEPGHPPVIERIPFPHPPRCKIQSDGVSLDALLDERPMDGKQTWLVVRNTTENLADLSEEAMLGWLVDHGALPGSRVTFDPIPVETVRAAEITDAQHLRDKAGVWAEASGLVPPTDPVLAKADTLEDEAIASGAVGEGLHIRVRSLTLRGAIGIWRGLGVDEVSLDLDAYEPGLVALVGPNGAGKSTLIENLHPYTQMLTRGGGLAQHFRLKDSRRELKFIDARTGAEYRALILIDPTLATPKTECYLYKDGEPLCTGRVKEYEELVGRLFGSLDLFVKSAFVAQKPPKGHPDLADATPAERKSLFRELGGLDYLQGYAERAKERADTIAQLMGEDRARASVIRPLLEQEPDRIVELARTDTTLEAAKAQAETVKAAGVAQRKQVEALAVRVTDQREITQRRGSLLEEHARMKRENDASEQKSKTFTAALAGRPAAVEIVQKADDLDKAKEDLSERKAKMFTERDAISTKHAAALAAHLHDRDQVQAEIRRMEKQAADLRARKAGFVATVDTLGLQAEQPIDDTCPTCGQTLPEGKRAELEAARDELRGKLAQTQEAVLAIDNALIEAGRIQSAAETSLSAMIEPRAPTLPTFEQQPALDAVLAALAKLDVPRARETIRLADAAEAQIAAARTRGEQIAARLTEIDTERTALMARVDETVGPEHAKAQATLDELREQYTTATAEVARLEAEVKALRATLADLAQKRATLAEIEARIAAADCDLADWRYLERACGRDGIQALELDAMGPSIAETANGLLDAAYGSRFRVEIRTTRIAGRGSKTKQVEDFELIVHDTERGTEQPLDTLSGGETVWIRKALYDAFGIIRARTTGTKFLTVCLDEADGALDPEARRRYVAMLRAAHEAAGRRHTICITHSEDAQQAIGQRIDMREFAGSAVTA